VADLAVLFLTGHTDAPTLQRIFAAGADDFVAKPIDPALLLTRVRNRLERVRLHRALVERDQLTGLSNRPFSTRALDRMLAGAEASGEPVGLAVVDIDHFKRINDRFGHAAGDRVLRGVADVLRAAFRTEDIVARWGGEEFVVGMCGTSAEAVAGRVGEALQQLRDQGVPGAGDAGRSVTFSAGVAQSGPHGKDLDTIYRAADEALYRAKGGGRDRVVVALAA
jgi:diguanylate cyclase (GGDEF)-like protein